MTNGLPKGQIEAHLPYSSSNSSSTSPSSSCCCSCELKSTTFTSALAVLFAAIVQRLLCFCMACTRIRCSAICSGVSRRPELSIRNVSGHLSRMCLLRFSRSGIILLPSMWPGVATPAMSRKVGARSTFNTISSTLHTGREVDIPLVEIDASK